MKKQIYESEERPARGSGKFVDCLCPLERNDVASYQTCNVVARTNAVAAVFLFGCVGRFGFRSFSSLFRQLGFLFRSHVSGNNFAFGTDFHLQIDRNLAMQA